MLGSGPNGEGTRLHLTNSSSTLTPVAGLLTVNRPVGSIDAVEITSHDSAGVREFMAGLLDPGELSGTMLYVPGSPTDLLMIEHLTSRETRPFKIVVVEPDGTTQDVTGNLFLTAYEPDDAPVDGRREASFSAKVSGSTTQAATAA